MSPCSGSHYKLHLQVAVLLHCQLPSILLIWRPAVGAVIGVDVYCCNVWHMSTLMAFDSMHVCCAEEMLVIGESNVYSFMRFTRLELHVIELMRAQ